VINLFSHGCLKSEDIVYNLPFSQLTKDISACLCQSGSDAFQFGCKTYLWHRLQDPKSPGEAASKATDKCEKSYGPTKPNGNAKCKEGINFLRNKE
jgi:hypothetical protein